MKALMPLAVAGVFGFAFEARAAVVSISDAYSGWYRSGGTNNSDFGEDPGPGLFNYAVGRTDPSDTLRNYFVFDLSGVTGLNTRTGTQLSIFSPIRDLPGSGYVSTDSSVTPRPLPPFSTQTGCSPSAESSPPSTRIAPPLSTSLALREAPWGRSGSLRSKRLCA